MFEGNKKLLLIDDEEVILFGFKQVLSGPGVAVDTASTVEEAKRLAAANSYDAAVVDLRLSNSMALEGLELACCIKNRQEKCRIIILTAYGDDAIRSKAINVGADLFLEKPVDPNVIKKDLEAAGIYWKGTKI